MALFAGTVNVTDTATLIFTAVKTTAIKVVPKDHTPKLGPNTVTYANGFPLAAGVWLDLILDNGDSLYGVVDLQVNATDVSFIATSD